jgi:hypothetical protein
MTFLYRRAQDRADFEAVSAESIRMDRRDVRADGTMSSL